MENVTPFYISGMAMLCSIGASVHMVLAATKAGINRYQLSRFKDHRGQPVRLAVVPQALFDQPDWDIEESDHYSEPKDHSLKMTLHCLAQLEQQEVLPESGPLLLAGNEPELNDNSLDTHLLKQNLSKVGHDWVEEGNIRVFRRGRAAAIEAMQFASDHLISHYPDGIVVGGSDCPSSYPRLDVPDQQRRLLSLGTCDGYAPGEGAAFVALTTRAKKALKHDGHIIRIHSPALGEEPGHWFSQEPYRGEGLDQAVKGALHSLSAPPIDRIYSSANGERYWAKELGVAQIRNNDHWQNDIPVFHPAEYYGDLGCATAPALIALASQELTWNEKHRRYLVYSSSDAGLRGAVILEKQHLNNANTGDRE